MSMGAGTVYINRERIYERLCRAFLVSGSKRVMPGYFYPVCKADPEGNAIRHYIIRIYG